MTSAPLPAHAHQRPRELRSRNLPETGNGCPYDETKGKKRGGNGKQGKGWATGAYRAAAEPAPAVGKAAGGIQKEFGKV